MLIRSRNRLCFCDPERFLGSCRVPQARPGQSDRAFLTAMDVGHPVCRRSPLDTGGHENSKDIMRSKLHDCWWPYTWETRAELRRYSRNERPLYRFPGAVSYCIVRG